MSPSTLKETKLRIAKNLPEDAPEGWQLLRCSMKYAGSVGEGGPVAQLGDGTSKRYDESWDVSDDFELLRSEMYEPGRGTWFTATATLTRDGELTFDFDFDNEPDWFWSTPAIVYLEDLKRFPRDEAHQPEWLKERLAEALRAQAATASTSSVTASAPGFVISTSELDQPLPAERLATVDIAKVTALHQDIGTAMVESAPRSWAVLTCLYSQADTTASINLTAQLPKGNLKKRQWSRALAEALYALRAEMYEPGTGTWWTAVVTLTSEMNLSFDFSYDDEPEWEFDVPDETYVRDQERFPRDVEHQPSWLQRRLT